MISEEQLPYPTWQPAVAEAPTTKRRRTRPCGWCLGPAVDGFLVHTVECRVHRIHHEVARPGTSGPGHQVDAEVLECLARIAARLDAAEAAFAEVAVTKPRRRTRRPHPHLRLVT